MYLLNKQINQTSRRKQKFRNCPLLSDLAKNNFYWTCCNPEKNYEYLYV